MTKAEKSMVVLTALFLAMLIGGMFLVKSGSLDSMVFWTAGVMGLMAVFGLIAAFGIRFQK